MHILTAIILFTGLLTTATAPPVSDCRRTLDHYFKTTSISELPPEGKVYYMDMKIKSVMYDSLSYPNNESSLKITVSKDQYYYRSEQMDYYKDKKNAFLVLHGSRLVIWTNADDIPQQTFSWNSAFALRDSLIRESQVAECADVFLKGLTGKSKKIVLEPPAKRQAQTKIRKMEFYFDSKGESLHKYIAYYHKQSNVYRTITTFNEMNFDAPVTLSRSVKELVLDKNNKPSGAYKGYSLVDQRK